MTNPVQMDDPAETLLPSSLLDALYGGLLDAAPWEGFLRVLQAWLDSSYATLILTVPGASTPGMWLTPGADPQVAEDYLDFFTADPFIGLPEGEVVLFADFVDQTAKQNAEFRRAFLEAAGGDQILGVDLRATSGFEARIRVTRDQSRPHFDRAARDRLQALVPHIRTAIRLYERLATIGTEQGVFQGAIEQMAVATIILDHGGRILRTNARADLLLGQADGIVRTGDRLVLGGRDEQKALETLLRTLGAESDPRTVPPVRLRLERPSGARDLAIVGQPVAGPAFMRGGAAAAVALFVSEPGARTGPSPEAIRDLFQLTPAEAQLAAALANGASLIDAADRLGVTHNTVRGHLRAIFAKTGVRRQSQLVHLLNARLP
ncbi:DNA-binding transcriptional regulator, CsgD family [Sphingomonas laterariae]|uniref:DNA-binding transcriptional regulator, CsgD family n=1 Tax=Edaphosphingomonas laterariae TaxID=861865 RepID=A0A239D198_9SPHN|nr:LuxR C-terminal-related transcriptional regulator [Sphingomonas laterariae]SNS26110.1 DNA-binding transcriptional regulator, CsgD family [Sphingomonas laterariae]